MQNWNIFKRALTQSFMNAWEYRTDFYSSIIVQLAYMATIFVTVYTIFQFVPFLNGWSIGEILIFAFLTDVSSSLFFSSGYKNLIEYVTSGELNLLLIKPVNTIFLLGAYSIGIIDLLFSIFGIVAVFIVAIYYSLNITALSAILATIQVIISIPIFAIPLIMIMCLAFYWGDVNNLYGLYQSINFSFKDYPVTIMGKFVITIFAFLSPAVLVSWVIPTMILLNKLSWQWSLFFIGSTILLDIILFILLKRFFYRALRRYEGFG